MYKIGSGKAQFEFPDEPSEMVCARHPRKGLRAFWNGAELQLRCVKCEALVGLIKSPDVGKVH